MICIDYHRNVIR